MDSACGQIVGGGHLDATPALHHHQTTAQMRHHRQVMADHHVGQAAALAQIVKQVEDLGLHRGVQRRSGFIEQQNLRLQNQGACNRHALTLPARELMRVAKAKA